MECNVKGELNGSKLTITVEGEIDHHSARELRKKIDELLYYYRPKKAALDLSSVSFMDSSGLGLILGRFTLVRELGGELILTDPNESVSKVLDLAGTSRLIKIEKTSVKGNSK